MTTPDQLHNQSGEPETPAGAAARFPSFRASREMMAFLPGAGREFTTLGGETLRILCGRSDLAPTKADRRFSEAAWTTNPAFHRLMQTYLAGAFAVRIRKSCGWERAGPRLPGQTRTGPQDFRIVTIRHRRNR